MRRRTVIRVGLAILVLASFIVVLHSRPYADEQSSRTTQDKGLLAGDGHEKGDSANSGLLPAGGYESQHWAFETKRHHQSKGPTQPPPGHSVFPDASDLAAKCMDEDYVNQVVTAFRNGELPDAADILWEIIQLSQWKNLSAIHGLVELYLEQEMVGEALETLKLASAKDVLDIDLKIMLANVMDLSSDEGERMEAERIVAEIISNEPDNIDALHAYKAITINNGLDSDYLATLEQLLAQNVSNPTLSAELATEYINTQDYAKAEQVYADALLYYPDNQDMKRGLADVLALEGKPAEAIQWYTDFAWQDPENAYALLQLGNMFLQQKDNQQASNYYQAAIEVAPEYSEEINRALTMGH